MTLMATYKPIKKWFLPLLSISVGVLIGFSFFPSKQEYHHDQWIDSLSGFEKNTYKIQTHYKRDDQIYSKSEGSWSAEQSVYTVITPISDGDEFRFDVYFFEDLFYIKSGDEWIYGKSPHRFLSELTPLDQPFKWARELLDHADEVQKIESEFETTYKAIYHQFANVEFRGVVLNEQKNTTLTMVIKEDKIQTITFEAEPKRPSTVGPLTSYPDYLSYELSFLATAEEIPSLPDGADSGEELE